MATSDHGKVIPQYADPASWHPKNKSFTVIDWERFESTNPKPPKVYRPPQFKDDDGGLYSGPLFWPAFWSSRSPWCNACPYPFSIATFFHRCWGSNAPYGRRKTAFVTEDDIFADIARPEAASPAVPDVLKGVLWMRDNYAPENLMTFQSWAWKSNAVNAGKPDQLENPNGDGVIGVGSLGYNWTNDHTCFGCCFGGAPGCGGGSLRANVQMSPSGKWIALFFDGTFPGTLESQWHYIYVVQEGDDFEIPEEHQDPQEKWSLKPGDLIRITWDMKDPYANSNDKMVYLYVPRRVASWDEEKQELIKYQPDFDDFQRRAVETSAYEGPQPFCCGFWSCNMTGKDRRLHAARVLSKRQWYTAPPPAPSPKVFDDI